MDAWTLRPYRISDLDGILSLIRLVQPHTPYTLQRWTWEYPECPGGPGQAWIAELDGRVISHTGALPFDWHINRRKAKAVLWVDTMTHPEFRHRGLHASMKEMALQAFCASDHSLAYVFPNDKSAGHIAKTQWHPVMKVPHLVRSARPGLRSGKLDGVRVERWDGVSGGIDRLCDSLREAFRFALVRDRAYLSWRYRKKPGDVYLPWAAFRAGELVGYLIYKDYHRADAPAGSHIVDVWTDPEDQDAMAALVRQAVSLSERAGANSLSCWMPRHAPLHGVLREHGFDPDPQDRTFFARVSAAFGGDPDEIRDPANWYITMGDSDVY
ncbi:MAG: GNAT family N-acetyltransferase [bacterium]